MMIVMMAKVMTMTYIMTMFTKMMIRMMILTLWPETSVRVMAIIVNLTICKMLKLLMWVRVLIGMVIMIMMIMVLVILTKKGHKNHIKNISGKLVGYKLQKGQVNWGLLLKLMFSQGWYKHQRDDYDYDLGHDYGNGCDLNYLQDNDTRNSHDGDECFR